MCNFIGDNTGDLSELLKDSPRNWNRWGEDDEVGSLNFLTPEHILASAKTISSGKTFTLGLEVSAAAPNFPGRLPSSHFMSQDKGRYESGKSAAARGGVEYADDVIFMALHGPTHCDALGHTWYDDKSWNGFDASETKGGMGKAGILPIAEKGIVGRSVLIDVARYKGLEHLPMHYQITLKDILDTARFQEVEIQDHDILILRTGIFTLFYGEGAQAFYGDFDEPGISYQPELVEWFSTKGIAVLGTDTIMNEQFTSSTVESLFVMHAALSRNLGIVFHEALWLESWADDCAADKKYDALYVASPLKIVEGTASPVNPIVIK
jgi:kynurenine formamidase